MCCRDEISAGFAFASEVRPVSCDAPPLRRSLSPSLLYHPPPSRRSSCTMPPTPATPSYCIYIMLARNGEAEEAAW